MTGKKVEILGANVDDVEFSLLNKEFQIGIFRAIANEEGLLLYINKILIEKLQYDAPSEFLYKKLVDLYYNPSDWLNHLDCIRKEGACLFRNVALKSSAGKAVNLDIYFTLTPPYVYGIVRDMKKEVQTIVTEQKSVTRDESKYNEIIVIDLDKPQKLNINPIKDN